MSPKTWLYFSLFCFVAMKIKLVSYKLFSRACGIQEKRFSFLYIWSLFFSLAVGESELSASQVLYHLSHTPALFTFSYFSNAQIIFLKNKNTV
jgi:hypothetical protein